MAKILIVEDDPGIRGAIVDWLENEKHLVEVAESGADALQLLDNFQYEVIILDLGLPDLGGAEVLRKFREARGQTPVIILSGRSDLRSKTEGLDLGADDYLTKPIELPELSARIRSRLRRVGSYQPLQVTVGNISVDGSTRQVLVTGETVHLTNKEFAVLDFLLRHRGQSFSARALRDRLWPSDATVAEDTVRVCIQSLRRKITNKDHCIVKTVLGSGYTIDAE